MMMESRIMSLIDGTDPSLEILRNMSQTERELDSKLPFHCFVFALIFLLTLIAAPKLKARA